MKLDLTSDPVPEVWGTMYRVEDVTTIVDRAEQLVVGSTEPDRIAPYESATERLGFLRTSLGSFAAAATELGAITGDNPNDTQVTLGELMAAADRLTANNEQPFQIAGVPLDYGGWIASRAIEGAVIARLMGE
jgi:hypothetical protein